ncbi:MAG: hypothetical protein Q8Q00_05285, partial [Dehalococcoidia bacterium]|nr:hypothetical protein [Dehalococcoidia bacterium]
MDQTLLTCFKQQNLTPSDGALQLRLSPKADRSVISLEEAIQQARINDKLKYGLKKALGIQLGRRKVWNDWAGGEGTARGQRSLWGRRSCGDGSAVSADRRNPYHFHSRSWFCRECVIEARAWKLGSGGRFADH